MIKAQFSSSLQDTVNLVEDNPVYWLDSLSGVDELDSVIHDLLHAGRGDLALPFYMKMREQFESLIDRSLRLYNITGE